VVADAVQVEPVSAAKFPANREKNREFRRIRPLGAILKADTRADSKAFSQIPYTTEQGIVSAEQGIFAREQGILLPGGAGARAMILKLVLATVTDANYVRHSEQPNAVENNSRGRRDPPLLRVAHNVFILRIGPT